MMTTTPDMIVSVTAIAWSIGVPYLPDNFFAMLDNILGVVILLVVALIALPYGPVPGVLTLIAVAVTFVERNRRKVATKLLNEGGQSPPTLQEQLAPSPPMNDQEIHPQWDTTPEDETTFFPEETQTDAFEPVASSINEKSAIPTINTNTGTDSATRFFVNQHLAKTDLD